MRFAVQAEARARAARERENVQMRAELEQLRAMAATKIAAQAEESRCARVARRARPGFLAESAIIERPPAEETRFDWLELPDPPPRWVLSGAAHLR